MTGKKRVIDPASIFMQAEGFSLAYNTLVNTRHPDHIGAIMGPAAIVLSALSVELFIKCIICMQTGKASRGHHLKQLFDQIEPATRKEIYVIWDTEVVPRRREMWAAMEGFKSGLPTALPEALSAGSKAFEKLRYSYEGELEGVGYTLTDLPTLLKRIVLSRRPEWLHIRRVVHPWPREEPTVKYTDRLGDL